MKSADTTRTVLDNGMIVLITERHSAPVVAINTWVNTGYFNEPDSLTGISHLLEHMFFKGTKKREVGQLREETKRLGGYLNAGTIYEYTHYYSVLPGEFVKEGLELQSDALWNSVLDSMELDKEKKVVIEEVKRKLDNPDALAWEKLMELAFDRHPIRRWRMGTPEQIQSWSREQFQSYFSEQYRPDNMILSIVGDFHANKILQEVKRYYGNARMEKTKKIRLQDESEQKELRYRQMKGDITQSYLKMGFHIPGRLSPDSYVLEVLAYVLGSGRSSRLSQSLVENQKLVSAIKSEAFGLRDVGFFLIEAELQAENLLRAESEIFREIESIKRWGISDYELTKAKNAIKFSYLSSMETAEGLSENLALCESYGDYRLAEEYLKNVDEVTSKVVIKAATEYLTLQNASVLEYRPDGEFDAEASVQRVKEAVVAGSGEDLVAPRTMESPMPMPHPTWVPRAVSEEGVSRESLADGATLITKENHSLPLVSFGIFFKGGGANETKANCGITRLTLKASLKGTEHRTGPQVFNELEMLGASIETEAEADYFGYMVKMLSDNVEPGLDVLADVIMHPLFDPAEIEKERRILLAEIDKSKDNMQDYPIQLFHRAVFPGQPYGLDKLGEKDAVERLDQSALRKWHDSHFMSSNMTIVVVGDLDSASLKTRLRKLLADREEKTVRRFGAPPVSERNSHRAQTKSMTNLVVENRSKAQTAQALGFVTCAYREDDVYALKVLQAVASGGGGRFYRELREKRGLAYTVYGMNDSWDQTGAFYAYIATSPEKEELAREKLSSEFCQFTRDTVTDDELHTAKRYITGMYRILLETNSALIKQYAKAELLGKGISEVEAYPLRIEEVTKEQVKGVALKYFDPEMQSVGVVRGKR
ncbi:MAG: pitrilysin family protein [Candidatus Zixiibacteriota bacterium]